MGLVDIKIMTEDSKPRVLVVDDSATDLEIISIVCNALGCNVDLASDGPEAIKRYREGHYDLVLTDYVMEPMNGIYVVSQIKEIDPDAICLMVTGFPDSALRHFAEEGGVFGLITKPIQAVQLKETLRLALNESKGATEAVSGITLSNRMDNCAILSGNSPAVIRLRGQVAASIESQKPVHVIGANGSGKLELAKFIHNNGPHAGKPMVEVPCAQFGESSQGDELAAEGGEWRSLLKSAEGSTLVLNQMLSLPVPLKKDLADDFIQISEKMHLFALSEDSLDKAFEKGLIDDDFYFNVQMDQIEMVENNGQEETESVDSSGCLDAKGNRQTKDESPIGSSSPLPGGTCPACKGSGDYYIRKESRRVFLGVCPECGGTGKRSGKPLSDPGNTP